MNLFFRLCVLCVSVAGICGCAGTALPSPFPTDPIFKTAEENFLNANYNEAIAAYTKFIESQKEYSDYIAQSNYRIGLSYLALANYAEAEKYLMTALKNPPKYNRDSFYVLACQSLAQVFQAQDKYDDAVYYFRKAVKNNTGELTANYLYYNLGVCLMRNDRYAEGKEYLELCLKNTNPETDEKMRERVLERLSCPPNIFTVQLGKFRVKENAYNYQQELREDKKVSAVVNIILIEGKEYYYVWSGRYETFAEAQKVADRINDKGIEAVVVP